MASKSGSKTANKLLKDYLDQTAVMKLAATMAKYCRGFQRETFVGEVLRQKLLRLELKNRAMRVATVLHQFLPDDYDRAAAILVKAAPGLPWYLRWVLTAYVEQFGLEHFETSLAAMKELTKYSSAEFAIRPYMIRHTDRMMEVLGQWIRDDDEHVRRLAAEGCRPRGVWVAHIEQFKRDPRPVLLLLEQLKADPSEYVRRAVANNLNDISKDNPALFIETARRWQEEGNAGTDGIIKHAARTLIKKGDPRAMALFGCTASPKIAVERFEASRKRLRVGDSVFLAAQLKSKAGQKQKLVIDYRVRFVKANGKTSSRVFKWTQKSLGEGETVTLKTKHAFVDRSTRKRYRGRHVVELIVNGEVAAVDTSVLAT